MSCKSFKAEIFFTLPVCGVVFALACTSMVTEEWVAGSANRINASTDAFAVDYNYGLFAGKKTVTRGQSPTYDLKITCHQGSCYFSCSKDRRKEDFDNLFSECPYTANFGDNVYCDDPSIPDVESCDEQPDWVYDSSGYDEKKFLMRDSTYTMTITFLVIGLLWTIVAIIFGVLNAFSNPIQWIVSYYGLLIWNGVACFCYFVTVCTFAGEFNHRLRKSAPISDVVRLDEEAGPTWESKGMAHLGYSYWLTFVCFLLHAANLGLVAFYIVKRDKPQKIVQYQQNKELDKEPDKGVMIF